MVSPPVPRRADSAHPLLVREAGVAAQGHFDELRGTAASRPPTDPTPAWAGFLQTLANESPGDLDGRSAHLERQLHDNGVTYNVHGDAKGPQRPGLLELFPLIVTADSWRSIEAGVLQRMALLEAIMTDVYGPQRLIASNLLPPALVHGHPGYLHALHGTRPAGGRHLHLAAFDLARGACGNWWVVSQQTQSPSGLGYLLENRQIISRQFPQAFENLRVQHLTAGYRALIDGLRAASPAHGQTPCIVLLTPGPYNETYFEQAFLARHLGIALVEGNDLTVRNERLYLKTVRGLEPVHGIVKRLDDELLDPLELRADSYLGVPGLLQVIRAGHVIVANAPGSGFLESPGLLGFLPALARQLLGRDLLLPSLASWWCGERAARDAVLPSLGSYVIKTTYAHSSAQTVRGQSLSRAELDAWADRLARQPDDYTIQHDLPLSQLPTWNGGRITPRSLLLRVFVLPGESGTWRVLPGGLTRLADAAQGMASMQRGGSRADTWVLTEGDIDQTPLPAIVSDNTGPASERQRVLTSRAAENLFWMGRYTERTDNTARLAHQILERLQGQTVCAPLLAWIDAVAVDHTLVRREAALASQAGRGFERALIAALGDPREATSVGFNLTGLRLAASAVREQLSQAHWNLIERTEQEFLGGYTRSAQGGNPATLETMRVLQTVSARIDAMTGPQAERMTHDDGWRLLLAGQHLERLVFLARVLARGIETGAVFDAHGFDALLEVFDSTVAYRAIHPGRQDLHTLVDLLVLDPDRPHSLGGVIRIVREQLAQVVPELDPGLPDMQTPSMRALFETDALGSGLRLLAPLQDCVACVYRLSDTLATRCFNPAGDAQQSVGV